MTTISSGAIGVSPHFKVTAEEFSLQLRTAVTRVKIDGVEPPTLGVQGGSTVAFAITNRWSPWVDEKLVEPKFDGVARFTGVASNRPSFIRDYHVLAMMRAIDYLLAPRYEGLITAEVQTVSPKAPAVPQ